MSIVKRSSIPAKAVMLSLMALAMSGAVIAGTTEAMFRSAPPPTRWWRAAARGRACASARPQI